MSWICCSDRFELTQHRNQIVFAAGEAGQGAIAATRSTGIQFMYRGGAGAPGGGPTH